MGLSYHRQIWMIFYLYLSLKQATAQQLRPVREQSNFDPCYRSVSALLLCEENCCEEFVHPIEEFRSGFVPRSLWKRPKIWGQFWVRHHCLFQWRPDLAIFVERAPCRVVEAVVSLVVLLTPVYGGPLRLCDFLWIRSVLEEAIERPAISSHVPLSRRIWGCRGYRFLLNVPIREKQLSLITHKAKGLRRRYQRTLDAGRENVSYAKWPALCSCSLDFCCDIASLRISSRASGVISSSSASCCACMTSLGPVTLLASGWRFCTSSAKRTLLLSPPVSVVWSDKSMVRANGKFHTLVLLLPVTRK